MQSNHRLTFFVVDQWYRPSLTWFTFLLLPFSWLFCLIITVRKWLYRANILKQIHLSIPVIVVGNITAGGTGKTPFVIWLVDWLQKHGYKPGIVSRGVSGVKHATPYQVQSNDAANKVGDEALLLAKNANCPIVICTQRAAAARYLQEILMCDIIISDDGLQHYQLARDVEIVIIDGARQFGNRQLIPAGPLRESIKRLKTVDLMVINGEDASEISMQLQPVEIISIKNPEKKYLFNEFPEKEIDAVAGIGNPERFFLSLKQAGFNVSSHAFPDHHQYQASDFYFAKSSRPILMTEKDAVKCRAFADERYWYVKVNTVMTQAIKVEQVLLRKIKGENKNDSEEDFSKRTCRLDNHR